MNNSAYIPALGRRELTGMYDWVIAAMTRERVWRSPVLTALDARTGEVIVDLGAGTGSLGIMIKKHAPGARLVAVDPDPDVRPIGERKARAAGVEIDYETAMGHAHLASVEAAEADTVTCSLVRRQCPLEAKQSILENAFRLLKARREARACRLRRTADAVDANGLLAGPDDRRLRADRAQSPRRGPPFVAGLRLSTH